MDICGKPESKLDTMDVEDGAMNSNVRLQNPSKRSSSNKLLLALASTALVLSIVGVGLGIAANVRSSSNRVSLREISRDDGVILVNSMRKTDGEYKNAGALFAGTGYWAQMKDMIYQRSDLRAIPSGDIIYLLGGQSNGTNSSVILTATTAYDTYTGTMEHKAEMPQARYRHAAAALEGKIYVIGGMSQEDGAGGIALDTVMVYDIASNSWSTLPARLNHARSDCCAASLGGKVYVAGGYAPEYSDVLASVEEFDPATGKWSLLANMSMGRGDCEAVALNNELLLLGGVDIEWAFTSKVEAYSPSTRAWRALASMARRRGDFAAEALPGGRLIVLGGETTNGQHTEIATNYAEEYIAVDDVWVPKAPLPEARFRHDAAHVGDKVFVFGGHPTCNSTAASGSGSLCYETSLKSVWGYFDVEYPTIYALAKQA